MGKDKFVFDDTSIAFASRSNKDLKRMHFIFSLMNWRQITKIGTKIVKTAFFLRFPVKDLVKNTLFKHFCGGESLEECKSVISNLAQYKIKSIPDYSVEGESKEKNFDQTTEKVLESIQLSATSVDIGFAVFKVTGLGSFPLLEKVNEGKTLTAEEEKSFEGIKNRVDKICKTAFEKNVKVLIDAEESWVQGSIDLLAYTMMNRYNQDRVIVYNTFQMYRKDMLGNLKNALRLAQTGNFFLGAKLVRGAYMEKERKRAKEKNYPNPIHESKEKTDEAFNESLKFSISHIDKIYICCGSHNEESHLLLMDLMDKNNISKNSSAVYSAQLYGMGDHISYNLAKAGYNVAKYLPYGPVESVMPYLMRRAEENSSLTGQTSRELNLIKKELKRRGLKSF